MKDIEAAGDRRANGDGEESNRGEPTLGPKQVTPKNPTVLSRNLGAELVLQAQGRRLAGATKDDRRSVQGRQGRRDTCTEYDGPRSRRIWPTGAT